ncbi:MAG: hypothetical protein ACREIA_16615 [Opitutaceae bacterium]
MLLPCARFRSVVAGALVAATALVLLAGCATGDFLRSAHKSMARAMRVETPDAFFGPVLARATGEPRPPAPSWQARQHYLAVISHLEGLSPEAENTLKRQGTLGDAFALKTLAQWRLGRTDDARASALRARASGQEALDAQNRALLRAFEGVMRLHAAYDALEQGKPLEDIEQMITSESGVWRVLAGARTEVGRAHPLQRELILTRLAAYKVLRDAREKYPEAAGANEGDWKRLRAGAEVELAELAALPADIPSRLAAVVQQWQKLCGLDPPKIPG